MRPLIKLVYCGDGNSNCYQSVTKTQPHPKSPKRKPILLTSTTTNISGTAPPPPPPPPAARSHQATSHFQV
ncbi:hypothetical protein TSAR_003949 [Trichomalopsis sarcophagae]|uniref:Uncharacterized protein n=1 Tax=Trichomalopsis sarcophagae TaxID=543379 RepID=A0A232F3P6_9HYME|nr:hypothetical protein TSAR_003949 [Trichomalopsis sarcophagae]